MGKGRREAWEMTSEEFIGPAMVSSIFEIDGRSDEDYEPIWQIGPDDGLPEVWRSACGQFSMGDMEWDRKPSLVLFGPSPGGVGPVGFYYDGQCWVDEAHRGKGLGVELVLAAARDVGGSPTNNTEGLGFSEAGLAVHRKAHRVAVERAVAAGLPVPRDVLGEYGMGGRLP